MGNEGMRTTVPQTMSLLTLNDLELTSVRALVSYAAYHQNVSEALVKQVVSAEFGIADIEYLKRNSFDNAIRFLVDLQVDMLLN
jgi:hypothetical protein